MQIKTFSFLIFLSAILLSAGSSGQTWYWTSQADSSDSQTASQVAVDRNDNPVYTGYCNGTRMAFGNIGIDITGSQDDFLAKYNTSGKPLWARNATALTPSAYVYGMSVATDRNNAVIEAGYFNDSIAFGSYHLHSNSANDNSYIVKYDANGNVLWATAATASKSFNCENFAYTVATDKQNNILVTGYFIDTAFFGKDTLIAASSTDMFLVKYNSAGKVIWVRTAALGGGAYAYGFSVATDDSSNVYVGGNIGGTVTFGATPPLNGNGSVYLAKYDSSGKAKWSVNTTATPGGNYPTPVVVDKSNNVYIGAQFDNPSITFGPSVVTDGAAFDGCSNSLLAKYDRNGNPLWAACADFISAAEVCVIIESSAATDRCNNVYWSGLCSDSFGVGNVKVTVPNGWINQSTPFAYVIQLDSNGNAIAGAALANQNGNSFSNYMAVDSLSKALFASELVSPSTLVVGNDTVNTYLNNSTCFLSKFAVVPAIFNNNNKDSICLGDSIALNVVPLGNSTYRWSNGATTSSITVKPPKSTTYFVAINNGCIIDTSFVKVTVSSVSAGIKGKDSICKGTPTELIGSGGLTYKWSSQQTTDTIEITPATDTTYTLTAFNGGCSKDTTIRIHVLPLPNAAATATPDTICKGDSVLLSGSGGVSYKWSDGKTTSSIWVNPLANTTYTLYATGGNECSDSTTVKVAINPPLTASVSALSDTICPHGSTKITATANENSVVYKWNNGATTSSINVSDTVTTKYIATIYGPCNNVEDSVTITVLPLANPVIKGNSSKCSGVTDTLTVSGGTSYLWSNGITTDTCITGPINADSTITVIAYNSFGCPNSKSFKINVSPSPNVTLSDTNTCLNNPVTIHATVPGQGPYSYKWTPGGQTNSSITVPDTGQAYSVTVSNGCKTTQTIALSPIVPVLSACCDKLIFIGDDTIIVAQGLNPGEIKSYSWSPKVTCLNPLCDTVQVSPTVTTTYTVTGTDSLGCQIEKVVIIAVDIPCFNFTVPNVFTPTNSGMYGVDNILYIKTKNLNAWSIIIYDRWGKEMFKSSDPNQYWSGNTESGGQASAGVYYYIINATCQGTTYKKDGFVQLIR